MLAKVFSGAVHGVDGYIVTVEVDIAPGLPRLSTVGLPDTSIKEARDRVVSAVRNTGFDFPVRRITVNLAPANIKKEGPSFDLPIAVGTLAASENLRSDLLTEWCLLGELALDGSLRPVKGVLPIAIEVRSKKLRGIILPLANAAEASVVNGIEIRAASHLREVTAFLNGESSQPSSPAIVSNSSVFPSGLERTELDFSDVKGQLFAKRALEIASSGSHNVLMIGPPGSGKTMLSRRLATILPELSFEESIETTKIHSVSGVLPRSQGLVRSRPFRSPHHTVSDMALIGGGQIPRPGEVSLAHNGVLFLDELPEFHKNVLEVLRQPLELREVTIVRTRETLTFPANFMLVAAMNQCPCGFRGHPSKTCACTPWQVSRYLARISGPLLDRIDIHLEVQALKIDELTGEKEPQESSLQIRERVIKTRQMQKDRFKGLGIYSNGQMNPRQTRRFCELSADGKALLRKAIESLGLSARAYDRILKVARTISDMEGSERILTPHLAEAIQYRVLDRIGC